MIPLPPRPTLFPYTTLFRSLRLQLDLIPALDKHRRGHKQTVEARHVHIHSGAQGVVGIINSGKGSGGQDGSPARDNSSQSKSRSEEHTSELQSLTNLVCRLL